VSGVNIDEGHKKTQTHGQKNKAVANRRKTGNEIAKMIKVHKRSKDKVKSRRKSDQAK